jgi:glycosyltransferase involved in cell wall biosynthesis
VRIAFASPLPPATSGVADYAAELLPALAGAGLEPTLFYEGSARPELDGAWPAHPIGELRARASEFDLALYQLGNSAPHHAAIHRVLLELPGVVVLHEYMLHHLVRARTLDAGDAAGYVDEMRYCAGETGRREAQRLLDTHHPVDAWRFPLFERVVDRSLGIVVHSEFARRRVLASRAVARVARVPFPVDPARHPPVTSEEQWAARRELGLADGAFVLGSFGLVTPHKRLEPVLEAFAALRAERPGAVFLVCGEVSPHYDLAARIAERGADGVRVTGRLEPGRFRAAMCACDVAVNLRYPTGGETSASLLALLAAGTPALVSDLGSFGELPDGVVAKVPIDEHETAHLVELLRRLAADTELRRALGAAARRYVERDHAVGDTAAAYVRFLREVAAAPRTLAPAVPPLAPGGRSPAASLLASIGADVADLGLDEGEEELLAGVAREVAELGWAPRGSDA